VRRWRPRVKLRTPPKFWCARMRCKKEKQIPHEAEKVIQEKYLRHHVKVREQGRKGHGRDLEV